MSAKFQAANREAKLEANRLLDETYDRSRLLYQSRKPLILPIWIEMTDLASSAPAVNFLGFTPGKENVGRSASRLERIRNALSARNRSVVLGPSVH